jgi:nucleoside-diphosphate-sugar epimerase
MRLLVTGANGFVGRALCAEAMARGLAVLPATRTPCVLPGVGATVAVGHVYESTRWYAALEGCSAVVHLAARVHVMEDLAADPLDEFRRVNVQGTLNLATQAAAAGVKRFVFVSSVKVNGESTQLGKPFSADASPAPQDAYGRSKMEAEQGLLKLALDTGMEVVIIRPPLVYGPGVKGNFAAMVRWLQRGLPLPLGAIRNQRSLVGLGNLVGLMLTCLTHPAAANQTFMVSDGEDVSTTELLQRLGQALGRPARLLPIPASVLQWGANVLGKGAVAQRVLGSLQVDISKNRELLGWSPPYTLDEGLLRTCAPVQP